MKEKELQRAILDWLSLSRIFAWRNNTGGFAGEYKGKTRFFRFGAIGSPDIFALRGGKLFGIEVKGPKGKASEAQIAFGAQMERAGGIYIIAHGLGQVITRMEAEG